MSAEPTSVAVTRPGAAHPGDGQADQPSSILVVDDDPFIRALLTRWLASAGYETTEAGDLASARQALLRDTPSLVLLDVLLQDEDGLEVCRWLRDEPWGRSIPVIVLTGVEDEAVIPSAFDVGATDLLRKPTEGDLLIHRIRFALRAAADRREVESSRRSLEAAQRVARLGSFEVDAERTWLRHSAQFSRLLGGPEREGWMRVDGLLEQTFIDDRRQLAALLRPAPDAESAPLEAVIRLGPQAAGARWLYVRVQHDEAATWGVAQDITTEHERDERIAYLSRHDAVSGLLNAEEFARQMTHALTGAVPPPVAVLHIGLLRAEAQRLRLGPARFEELVAIVTRRLTNTVEALWPAAAPAMARLGGLEFGVLLREADQVAVADGAARLAELVSGLVSVSGLLIRVQLAVGIAASPDDGTHAASLLRAAGAARAAAVSAPGSVRLHDETLSAKAERRLRLEGEMERALTRQEFQLLYQPQVDRHGAMVGVEALIRWQHPAEGLISPAEFLPLAEENGLILPMGEWVLREAARQARLWLDAGHRLRTAVNLSPRQLSDPQLSALLGEVLDATGLPPELLELELTETGLIDPGAADDLLAEARRLGARIAVDDFGTGYSSLARVTDIGPDVLKIDRGFVAQLPTSGARSVIAATVALAAGEGIEVIAEGVETQAQRQTLVDLGVEIFQGYLFAAPTTAAALLAG